MSAEVFADLQEALLYVFLPIIYWLLAFLVAFGFFGAVLWFFLSLYRQLTRG
jgi:hypothetical protein